MSEIVLFPQGHPRARVDEVHAKAFGNLEGSICNYRCSRQPEPRDLWRAVKWERPQGGSSSNCGLARREC